MKLEWYDSVNIFLSKIEKDDFSPVFLKIKSY